MSRKAVKKKKRSPVKNSKRTVKRLFKKGQSGNPKGRPKGSKDKFTDLKNSFLEAFEKLGGVDALVEWAKKNANTKAQFYAMITKLFPRTIDVSASDSMTDYVKLMSGLWGSKKRVKK